jgi:hypothetical protein
MASDKTIFSKQNDIQLRAIQGKQISKTSKLRETTCDRGGFLDAV